MEPDKQSTGAVVAAAQSTTGREDNHSTEVAQRITSQLLLHDVREIQAVSEYACKREENMKTLSDEFVKKGGVKLFWDSKVPEKNKRFYYFFSLKSSNKDAVVAEIKKYRDFYRQLDELAKKIGSDELEAGDGGANPYGLVLDLCEDLTKLLMAAEAGTKTTDSSTVYELHRQFVAEHEKLENKMKRVECVALKQSWKSASEGLLQSKKAIDGLTTDLKASEAKFDRLCERFERLLTQNETLTNQQQVLLEENDRMMQQQQTLLEENGRMMQQQQTLMEDNRKMKQQQDNLIKILRSVVKNDDDGP